MTIDEIRQALAGKPLRYLIGKSAQSVGSDSEVIEVAYDAPPPQRGLAIKYCNLFDENDTGEFEPYLHDSDTAEDYGEGQIDPAGQGWWKNLTMQFDRAKLEGYRIIELDNPDAYSVKDVLSAIAYAATYRFAVMAKNPGLMDDDSLPILEHPNVVGIIVEKRAGRPASMDTLRRQTKYPLMPVRFVFHGSGYSWAQVIAKEARGFLDMGVTYSQHGEYVSSIDILKPRLT